MMRSSRLGRAAALLAAVVALLPASCVVYSYSAIATTVRRSASVDLGCAAEQVYTRPRQDVLGPGSADTTIEVYACGKRATYVCGWASEDGTARCLRRLDLPWAPPAAQPAIDPPPVL
jgi:hypothetical protein